MKISPNTLKWAIRLYPPLFFQRIWVIKFGANFRSVEVKINKSLLNTNYNRSIFGGTIFSATDPFYALLFDQVLKLRGFQSRVWLKSASIQYLKPGRGNLYFKIELSEADISEAEQELLKVGKFIKTYRIDLYNDKEELCAIAMNEVYVRNIFHGEHHTIAY
jgi:acyl-coenzyme A thioesterase PaaI-like protein